MTRSELVIQLVMNSCLCFYRLNWSFTAVFIKTDIKMTTRQCKCWMLPCQLVWSLAVTPGWISILSNIQRLCSLNIQRREREQAFSVVQWMIIFDISAPSPSLLPPHLSLLETISEIAPDYTPDTTLSCQIYTRIIREIVLKLPSVSTTLTTTTHWKT